MGPDARERAGTLRAGSRVRARGRRQGSDVLGGLSAPAAVVSIPGSGRIQSIEALSQKPVPGLRLPDFRARSAPAMATLGSPGAESVAWGPPAACADPPVSQMLTSPACSGPSTCSRPQPIFSAPPSLLSPPILLSPLGGRHASLACLLVLGLLKADTARPQDKQRELRLKSTVGCSPVPSPRSLLTVLPDHSTLNLCPPSIPVLSTHSPGLLDVPSGQRESKLGGTSDQADGGGTSWGPLLQKTGLVTKAALVMGLLPTCLVEMPQPCPRSGAPSRPTSRRASAKPQTCVYSIRQVLAHLVDVGGSRQEDECWSPVASDGLRATQRRPGPTPKPAVLRGAPCEAWLDPSEVPDTSAPTCSCPMWSGGEESRTGGNGGSSSVSSGRLSGSSGGHECTPAPGLWKERPPQVLGSPKQPRKTDPRLERLRDKIRAQAAWQASCGSLGTSAPSSASRLCKGSKLAPRKKVRKVARAPVPQASPDFSVRRAAETQVEDKASPRCEPARASQRPASESFTLTNVLSTCGLDQSWAWGLQERETGFRSGVLVHSATPAVKVDVGCPVLLKVPLLVVLTLNIRRTPREKAKRTKGCSCKREKASKFPSPRRAPKGKDSESVGVYAWRRGQDLVRLLLGPPPVLPGRRSQAPSREPAPTSELGDSKKVPTAPAQTPSPACSDQWVSANTPSLVSWDQPVTIQTAMAILQELRQQIQAGLDLAQRPQSRQRSKHRPPKLGLQDPTETRQQGPGEVLDTPGAFFKRPWAMTEDKDGHSERTCSFPRQQPCSASAGLGTSPKRAWDPTFQRPRSHPERQGSPLPRPWSTSAGQTCEDWDSPARWPWSPLERPWCSSFAQPVGSPCKGSFSRDSPGKERAQELPAGQRPRGVPGPPHSSASLQEFMRQKALARRQQMLEEKAAAVRALELRDHRLREVYRKQREAVLGRPTPVVSLTRPSIVTFVPHSAQDGDLDTPGSPGPPVLEWSKVTSGLMLGDQETPGSFCLCLNKAFSGPQTRKTKNGRPLPLSTNTSLRPWKLQDLPMNCSQPQQLCIYLDPKEAEGLGAARPLHYQYRQARLQALETTANALKQRIDLLTEKLQKPEAMDVLGDLTPSPKPPATTFTAPDWPRALVPSGEAGQVVSPLRLSDREALPLDSGQEWWQHGGLGEHDNVHQVHGGTEGSVLTGLTGHRPSSELEPRLASAAGTFHPVSTLEGSSHQVPATLDPPCGSLRLEEVLAARKDGVGRPRSTGICASELTEPCRCFASMDLELVSRHLCPPDREDPEGRDLEEYLIGGQQPDGPLLGNLQNGLLANIRQKSWSFLESLKLDQWKQAWELTLLRQRVEREVIETQTALDGLFLRPQLQHLAETHSTQGRPKTASELEQPPVHVDPELQWASAGPEQEAGGPNRAPSQQPPARLDPWDSWRMPDVTDQVQGRPPGASLGSRLWERSPGAQHQDQVPSLKSTLSWEEYPVEKRAADWRASRRRRLSSRFPAVTSSRPFRQGFSLQMLEQSLREEELRAQHQTALLRLREKALEEKTLAELAGLEHLRGCLEGKRDAAVLAALKEQEQRILGDLQREQREIRYLRSLHLSTHRERRLLLQHQRDLASMRHCTARLQRELWAGTTPPQLLTSEQSSCELGDGPGLCPLSGLRAARSQRGMHRPPHSRHQAGPAAPPACTPRGAH
ncbi:PREDICTED: uncharacterized protein LOC102833779 [Chrysochloris asiatica]|uniref:Uncharacterized protein LOC102833779 n=1 Tax=Chrysochloris asiatica TaxID=185453 RepID=A0A9B0TGW8_CHRAS|nr:PREDICTED: uncharacterized protein LOC102833779 [Chrysochloris asiatica]